MMTWRCHLLGYSTLTEDECTGHNVTLELVLCVTSHWCVPCDESPLCIHVTIEQTVNLASKCRVMEVQVPWPAVRTNTLDTIDQVDIRYERLILILQVTMRSYLTCIHQT